MADFKVNIEKINIRVLLRDINAFCQYWQVVLRLVFTSRDDLIREHKGFFDRHILTYCVMGNMVDVVEEVVFDDLDF